jgi:hypothetical protein
MSNGPLELITKKVEEHLAAPGHADALRARCAATLPAEQVANVDAVLDNPQLSYRDGLLIQTATGIALPGADITKRQKGGRSVAQALGAFLRSKHIPAVADAYQNIAKNTDNLVRGNLSPFDDLLKWAAGRSRSELELVLDYACARVAARARAVKPLPELNPTKLSFTAVMTLCERLRSEGSGGAYEQFIVASLLHGLIEGEDRRVTTKNISASDKSSSVAGDVQVWSGDRLLDAYEVTANEWREKLSGAAQTIKAHDLSRLNIIGSVSEGDYLSMLGELSGIDLDIAVQDLRGFCAACVAQLTRVKRAAALRRLYELLDRYQTAVERVNRLVDLLAELKLTV